MKTLATLPQVVVALALSVSMGLVGCQKKRDAKLSYGDKRDLLTLDSYENKDYDLFTKGLIKQSSTKAQLKIEDSRKSSVAQVKNFDYVDYDAKDPLNLTDKTLMLGRPNYQYKIRYVFSGTLLKVMKVSKPEDLAFDELASAEDAGNGLKMVPIVSYEVSFFSLDTSRNDLNEKTAKLELVGQSSRGNATHFKVVSSSKTRASFLSKTTVLPAAFFRASETGKWQKDMDSSEWYFSATVVSQNENENRGNLAALISLDKYGRDASKVRIRIDEDKISFYNVALDRRIKEQLETREETQASALTIPVEFVDYGFSDAGKGTSVSEVSSKERAWKERAYVDLKLTNAQTVFGDLKVSEIKDIQIDDGYFSFLVKSDAVGGLIRISLLNVKSYKQKQTAEGSAPYQKKVYFRDDHTVFGYFKTAEGTALTSDRMRTDELERLVYINRFNPSRKFIEYRLNYDTPEWAEKAAEKSVLAWNHAFEAAGASLRIKFWDENGKILRGQPGDLRYSLINMYTGVDGAGPWGGFGPSLADTDTGEIIMATASMDSYGYVDGVQSGIRQYLMSAGGAYESKYILGLPIPSLQPIVDAANKTIKFTTNFLGLTTTSSKRNIYDPVKRTFIEGVKNITEKAQTPNLNFNNYRHAETRYEQTNQSFIEHIKFHCPTIYTIGENAKQKSTKPDLTEHAEAIKACAIEISQAPLVSHLLHEIGHNLGLRHNFKGSADWRNFYGPVNFKNGNNSMKLQWESSSIMDYLPFEKLNMTYPGKYDVAALQWAYAGKVTKEDEKTVVAVKDDKPILAQVPDIRKFMYCSDEHDFLNTDPLCSKFDAGATPTDIAANLIMEYDASIATQNFRHGRDKMSDPISLAQYRHEGYLSRMRELYEQWRLILNTQAGTGKEYLESYDTKEEYERLIQRTLDPKVVGEQQAKWNANYKNAADMIFSFLLRMSFTPDYSCITIRESNLEEKAQNLQMFPFGKIQKILFNATGKTATSCKDKEVAEYLAKNKQAKVIAEVGHPFDNVYGDLGSLQFTNTEIFVDRPEIVGLAQDRIDTMVMLIEREPVLHQTRLNGFAPNFMDEWLYREILTQKIVERLTSGISMAELGLPKEFTSQFKNMISPNFESEKPLLGLMYRVLLAGQYIPNKTVETNKRLEKYAVIPFYMLSGDPDENPECAMIKGYRFCATDIHTVSKNLVKKLNSLQEMKAAFEIDDQAVSALVEITKDIIPAQFDQLDITFLDKLRERIEKLEKDPKTQFLALQLKVLMQIFTKEIRIWQVAQEKKLGKIQEADISAKESLAKLEELRKFKLKDLVEWVGLTKEDYTPLTHDQVAVRANELVKKLKADAKAYEADPTELDAQADLILEAVMNGNGL